MLNRLEVEGKKPSLNRLIMPMGVRYCALLRLKANEVHSVAPLLLFRKNLAVFFFFFFLFRVGNWSANPPLLLS